MKSHSAHGRPVTTWLCLALVLGSGPAVAVDLTRYGANEPYRYHHADPTFSFAHPWDWVRLDARPPTVLEVGSPEQLPQVRVLVLDEPWWLPLRLAGRAAMTQLGRMGRNVELVRSELIETEGTHVQLTWVDWTMNMGIGVPLHTLMASTFIDERWVVLMISDGAAQPELPDDLVAIAHSLRAD